jgi:ABC-type phosphate transport system substrate-binding protein
LSISGSTVLYPVISQVAAQYMKSCPGAQIQVSDRGTNSAIQQLIQGGKADQQTNSTEASRVKLAMADDYPGKALQDPNLGYWPIGIGAFVIVVNKNSGIARLSTRQVKDLFDGRLPKWNSTDLGGADQEVVLVSRTIDSGTRDTFVHRVLGHDEKAPVSSSDCVSRDIPGYQSQVMHCQVDNTQEMLRKVAATPGAIGYANAGEAAAITDGSLRIVPIDGYYPTKEAVANGRYRFWAVERLYRYGRQVPPTVRDHFVQYLLSQRSALDALASHGFFFCSDSSFSDGDAANACIQQDAPTPSHS